MKNSTIIEYSIIISILTILVLTNVIFITSAISFLVGWMVGDIITIRLKHYD